MNIEQLIVLNAVVKEGSFKKASEALFKTQPTLSVAIKNLEEEIGFKIFNRSDYRPSLTKKGRAFYEKSQALLSNFHSLSNFAKELSMGFESEIKISVDSLFPIEKLKSTLKKYLHSEVTTSLNLYSDVLEGSLEKVLNEDVDFALASYLVESNEIESIKLFEAKMIPYIEESILKKIKPKEAIKILPKIIVKSSTKNASDKQIGFYQDSRKWYTQDLSMKIELIKHGLGWGRLPSHLKAEGLKEIKGVPSIYSVTLPFYLLRKKSKPMGPNTKHLWEHIALEFK